MWKWAHAVTVFALLVAGPAFGDRITIDFDALPAMSYFTGTTVPKAARLSDGFLNTHGVVFRSKATPYVAVANLDADFPQAPSPPNGIGGVTAENKLDYATPIMIEFFLPGRPEVKGVTNFVSVATDNRGDGLMITLNAYDAMGKRIGSTRVADAGGPSITVSAPGIHSLEIVGQWGTAFDDLTFNTITAVGMAFRRGDATGDGIHDISDPVLILGCLFLGSLCGDCPDALDANDDGSLNIADPVFLLQWLFLLGSRPPEPSAECGMDLTGDALQECRAHFGCP